jgi:hypothetical protein
LPLDKPAIREAPGEFARYENTEGVPDSSLGLTTNATMPRAVRSPSSCTLKGAPERASCRAMSVACATFRTRMLWGLRSRGIAGLNARLDSRIPSECSSRPGEPRATMRRSRHERAARVPISGRGTPLTLSGGGWHVRCRRTAERSGGAGSDLAVATRRSSKLPGLSKVSKVRTDTNGA